VTFKEAQEMPYLQAVIKEILRMHLAVGTIFIDVLVRINCIEQCCKVCLSIIPSKWL
jgi:hypothetical protein